MNIKPAVVSSNKQTEEKRQSFLFTLFKRMIMEKPLGTFGLTVIVIFFTAGVFSKFIMPFPIKLVDLFNVRQPPSSKYLLGTDELGRDVLNRLIYGARVSLEVGFGAMTIATIISILIGATSGFLGKTIDMITQRFVDVWMSIPPFIILLIIMSIIPHNLFTMIMVIGITVGIGGARLIRSAVIRIKSEVYVSALDAIGCSKTRALFRHILPNIMPAIIIFFTLGVGGAIMQEAGLDMLGFGLPPGTPSWGYMLFSVGGIWAAFAISLTIYGINMFGDSLRDLLDPRLSGGVGHYSITAKKMKRLKEKLVKSI
jgi:peptide/nickel transport system permease protein